MGIAGGGASGGEDGGDLNITGGGGGSTGGSGGDVNVNGGPEFSGPADGVVNIGTTSTSKVTVGNGGTGYTTDVVMPDNASAVFRVLEGSNEYISIGTLNVGPVMTFGNSTTNPGFTFAGTADITLTARPGSNRGLRIAASGSDLDGTLIVIDAGDGGPDGGGGGGMGGGVSVSAGFGIGTNDGGTVNLIGGAGSGSGDGGDVSLAAGASGSGLRGRVRVGRGATRLVELGNTVTNPDVSVIGTGDFTTAAGVDLGFYGAAAVVQQTANVAITDSTTGTSAASAVPVPAVGGSGATTAQEDAINDNFATVLARLAAIRTLLLNYGLGV
jgi:hypothetical protein